MNLRRAIVIGVRWTVHDIRFAARHAVRSTLAGSPYMPRAGRFILYRIARIRTSTANITPGVVFSGPGHHLVVGERSAINSECLFDLAAPVTIGADTMFGNRVAVITSAHDIIDGVVQRTLSPRAVTIGDHVWVGATSTIMPGVTIESHVVIAAGAVVTRDCAAYGLYAGVPARRLRDLPNGPSSLPMLPAPVGGL